MSNENNKVANWIAPGAEGITTRSGYPVRIYAVETGQTYGVHGAYQHPDGEWLCETWTPEGRYTTIPVEDPRDLMPPKNCRRVYLAMWRHGLVLSGDTDPRTRASPGEIIALKTVTITEGEFDV